MLGPRCWLLWGQGICKLKALIYTCPFPTENWAGRCWTVLPGQSQVVWPSVPAMRDTEYLDGWRSLRFYQAISLMGVYWTVVTLNLQPHNVIREGLRLPYHWEPFKGLGTTLKSFQAWRAWAALVTFCTCTDHAGLRHRVIGNEKLYEEAWFGSWVK